MEKPLLMFHTEGVLMWLYSTHFLLWLLYTKGNTPNNYRDPHRISSGPGCSKLTTLLVNVSLKFHMLIFNIHHCFLLKKCEKLLRVSHFFNKNISLFGY